MKTAEELIQQIMKEATWTIQLALNEAYNDGFAAAAKSPEPKASEPENPILQALKSMATSVVEESVQTVNDTIQVADKVNVIDAMQIDDPIQAMIAATEAEAEAAALAQAAAFEEVLVSDDDDEEDEQPIHVESQINVQALKYVKASPVETDVEAGIYNYDDRLNDITEIIQVNSNKLRTLFKQVDDSKLKAAIKYAGSADNDGFKRFMNVYIKDNRIIYAIRINIIILINDIYFATGIIAFS
jgi:hypothetical protein